MSTQKGNNSRSRPQKYQNHTAFKNDLHDTTPKRKFINSIEIVHVCERCKKIIEWKIKYKKYKPLKAPAKCTKCAQKNVKNAYHTMCIPCAKQNKVCPKCTEKMGELQEPSDQDECTNSLADLQKLVKTLPERKRRTVIRYINKNTENPEHIEALIKGTNINLQSGNENDQNINISTINALLTKFQSVMVGEDEDEDEDEDFL